MKTTQTCPQGHTWEIAPDVGGSPSGCPICDVAAVPRPDSASDTATMAPSNAPSAPSGIAGRPSVPGYELLAELGRGGMGVVYQARHLKLDRLVALKMILAGGHAGPAERERFRVEAKAIARLQHPHIVQVHEVGEHDGLPYFSLEYCGGGTLAQKLAGTPLPPRQAAALVETLARAMHAAHQKGILHRDLKPANILLSPLPSGGEGPGVRGPFTTKITDFGLAKRLDEQGNTASGSVLGTPSYMAPEQAGGKKAVGPACDVYALGAILYECLTGRPPFKAATPLDTIMQVVSAEPVPVRQLNTSVPRDLETICLTCLHKEPARRYASAEALADDLRRFQAGEPILARPVGSMERLGKWVARNPAVSMALAAVVLALAAGTVVSMYFAIDAGAQAEQARIKEADAVAARIEVEQANKQLKNANDETAKVNVSLQASRDELERTLARSLLGPLGLKGNDSPGKPAALTQPEIAALWDLAGPSSDRLSYLFVEQALRSPATTRQLRNRGELALHAALGLSLQKHDQVEHLLVERLRHEMLDAGQRGDLALLATMLQGLDPASARLVAGVLVQALESNGPTTKTEETVALAQGLSVVALRLPPAEAAPLARRVANRLVKIMPDRAPAADRLAPGVSALAVLLEPEDAARIAVQLIEVIAKAYAFPNAFMSASLNSRSPLLTCLDAVAARLTPQQAAKATSALIKAMRAAAGSATADPVFGFGKYSNESLAALASGLPAVAARLAPRDAAPHYAEAADILVRAMQKLRRVEEWSGLEMQLLPVTLTQFARALVLAAPHLEPDDAARRCADAVAIVMPAMDKSDYTVALYVHTCVNVLAPWLRPDDAKRVVDHLIKGLGTSKDMPFEALRVSVLDTVARQLKAKDLACLTELLLAQAAKEHNSPVVSRLMLDTALAIVVSADAHRVDPAYAARIAAALHEAIGQTEDVERLAVLASGLAALAARLEPDDAAKRCGAAVVRIAWALEKHPRATGLPLLWLADRRGGQPRAMLALVQYVDANHAAQAADHLGRAMTKASASPLETVAVWGLARGLAVIASRLEPADAQGRCRAAAVLLTTGMSKAVDSQARVNLAPGLTALAPRLAQAEAARLAGEAAALIAPALHEAGSTPLRTSAAEAMLALAPWLPPAAAAQRRRETARSLMQTLDNGAAPTALLPSLWQAGMEQDELVRVATRIIHDLANNQFQREKALAHLAALVHGVDLADMNLRAESVVLALGAPANPVAAHGALAPLRRAADPLPSPLPPPVLVELLRDPFCVGEPRRMILNQLQRHYGRPFTDTWAFVRFAHNRQLDLDLARRPVRQQRQP